MTPEGVRVYLCGPMRKYPEFNHPAFHQAARLLRAEGYDVFSPAEHDIRMGLDVTGTTGDHAELPGSASAKRSARTSRGSPPTPTRS